MLNKEAPFSQRIIYPEFPKEKKKNREPGSGSGVAVSQWKVRSGHGQEMRTEPEMK